MESTIAAPEDIKVIETSEQLIPKELIYEVLDGKPIYFKGYKDVLNKTAIANKGNIFFIFLIIF